MAKFYLGDGSIRSFDRMVAEQERNQRHIEDTCESKSMKAWKLKPFKTPSGDTNGKKIINTCPYDLLTHIQEYMSKNHECILDVITGKLHTCQHSNCDECIQKWLNDSNW